jgi:hypothetical protein
MPGKRLAEVLAPLDREAADKAAGRTVHRPPAQWEGKARGSTEGNPFRADGRPLWRLDQVWPPDPSKPAHYKPMPWTGTAWQSIEHGHGGQPGSRVGASAIDLGVRTAWPGQPGNKMAALTFIAPKAGTYEVEATVKPLIWDSGAPIALAVVKLDRKAGTAEQIKLLPLKSKVDARLSDVRVVLAEGQELALVPAFPGSGLVAWTCKLAGLRITLAAPASPAQPAGKRAP